MFAACASTTPVQRSARTVEKRRGLREMEKAKRYEIEGTILNIPMHWDERSQQYLKDYSDLIESPVCTPEGRPILVSIEDACRYSEPAKDEPGGTTAAPAPTFASPRLPAGGMPQRKDALRREAGASEKRYNERGGKRP